jgi:hypothetical protein
MVKPLDSLPAAVMVGLFGGDGSNQELVDRPYDGLANVKGLLRIASHTFTWRDVGKHIVPLSLGEWM